MPASHLCDGPTRNAKMKLPKEIKKKVEKWKFMSGALVMCLVAYSDGKVVQAFQFINIFHLIAQISLNLQRQEFSCSREYVYQFL